MIGKVLNNRYELKELIGEGGMALVYKAKDQFLDRWVAVKILRPQLVSDHDFVRRFHREAKAVASLSHPNIVNIYDIGQDNNIQYLVMENIQGENLHEKIKRSHTDKKILPPYEAFNIASQICEALVVAHRNHIIHCDIKPHNIIITKEGGVKVTDFGIARAMNSATLAQTETVIGTAHYFSPEQAKGGTIDSSSDIYSLGVVLYEMLTGQVPFKADSPISVALKHINEEPQMPSERNRKLPKRVDALIMKALAKESNQRFQDASEMLRALRGMAKSFETNTQKKEKLIADNDQTQVMAPVREKRSRSKKGSERKEPKEVQERSFLERIVKPLLILIVTFILLGVGGLWALDKYTRVPTVIVPDFVGLSREEADFTAKRKGLRVKFSEFQVSSPEIPADHVVSQEVDDGKEVKKNRVINLTLSKGATMTRVPNLIGKDDREVPIALHEADLVLGKVEYQYTSKIPKGEIMTQSPVANTELKSGSFVDLVYSKGPEPMMGNIPNLIGLTQDEAERRILEENFVVGEIIAEESNRFKEGKVTEQGVAPGTRISEGTPINLKVSTGLRNPKGLAVNSFNVDVTVFPGPYEQQIQVVVEDDNGREIIYDKMHHPDDRFSIKNIHTVGQALLQVYNNGELIEESRIGF